MSFLRLAKEQERKLECCTVTESDREIFRRVMKRFIIHRLDHDDAYDEGLDFFFDRFLAGFDGECDFTLTVNLVPNDRIFMKMLIEESRKQES